MRYGDKNPVISVELLKSINRITSSGDVGVNRVFVVRNDEKRTLNRVSISELPVSASDQIQLTSCRVPLLGWVVRNAEQGHGLDILGSNTACTGIISGRGMYLVGRIAPVKWQTSPPRNTNVSGVVLTRADMWPTACPGTFNMYKLPSQK